MLALPKIFIVSPQSTASPLWAFLFHQQRLTLIFESNPGNALARWNEILPDLIVLDIDGEHLALQIITALREESVLPVLLLTVLRDEKFVLEAYRAGVDECIFKPIPPVLFHAKIRAWLRRSWSVPVNMLGSLRVGPFHLMPANRVLELEGRTIHLTTLELRLLYYLMGKPGHAATTEELCHRIWGEHNSEGEVAALKNLIYRLRHKLEADPANPRYIRNVAGVGYQLVAK